MKIRLVKTVLPSDPQNGVDMRFLNLCPFIDEVFYLSQKEYGESGKRVHNATPWGCTKLNELSELKQYLGRCHGGIWIAGDFKSFCALRELQVHPVVYDACDSQSLYFLRRFHYLPVNRLIKRLNAMRWYYAWSMRERQVAGYCQGVVVPARQDALAFTRWKRTQVAVISSGTMQIEQPELLRSPCARTMLFHGAFSWPVNRSTAEYLVNDIFPEVRKMEGAIELRIAGQPIPEELKNASSQPGIFMEGYVDDLRAWLSQCSVYVMPMLQGGGVKTKLFEAMAMGLPIVTNSMGAEAMDDVAKQCLVVADGTRPIADAVVRLIRNPKEAEAMGVRARQHAVKHFQWSRLSAQYRDFLLRIGSVAKVEDCPC